MLGGWTVSSIITFQTGSAFRIGGNNNTFNNQRDGGLALNGITAKDLQDRVGLYFNAAGQAYFLDPAAMTFNSGTSTWTFQSGGSVSAFSTPGEWGTNLYLHGPHQTYTDIGISKNIAFSERFKFKFQTEMSNAFNHPTFGQNITSIIDTGFGRGATSGYNPRRIEFRANLEF